MAAATLTVPTRYPTIQSAIDAARAGDRIRVLPGTYREQLSIDKDLRITGSGAGTTFVRAPATLAPGPLNITSIVEVRGGATVAISQLTVRGPGRGTCAEGSLRAGISVVEAATLDLSFASVVHVHDTPKLDCFPNGTAIRIGDPVSGSSGHATIRNTYVSDFQFAGILVFSGGSASISRNIIRGAGPSPVVANVGIDIRGGASASITDNFISGNVCHLADAGCGPDPMEQVQVAGIFADGPEVRISRNFLLGNDVGLYVSNGVAINDNVLVDNRYFGMLLQDGHFTVSHDHIWGGLGGVGVIALFADAEATLNGVRIARTAGAPVQIFECCGFTAAATTR